MPMDSLPREIRKFKNTLFHALQNKLLMLVRNGYHLYHMNYQVAWLLGHSMVTYQDTKQHANI